MRFLIDDERDLLPDKTAPDLIARTFVAGEILLSLATDQDHVWIDHDLGEEDVDKTGYRLLTNYEERIAELRERGAALIAPTFHCVSANAPGRDRINACIASIQRLINEGPEFRGKVRYPRVQKERSPATWRPGGPPEKRES